MKKTLISLLLLAFLLPSYSEPIPADDILEFVRLNLPAKPIELVGKLKISTKNNYTKSLPITINLNWGAPQPTASYYIGTPKKKTFQSLHITWKNAQPSYQFSDPKAQPSDEVLGTGITWADLSFSMLWWPHSQLIGEEKKINRNSYIIDIPIPDSPNKIRLWIDKKMGMLLESQTFNPQGKRIRRMKIKSIKKMDGMWVASDLEVKNYENGHKTTLELNDLKWLPIEPTAMAFDATESINQLAIDLYQELSSQTTNNLFLSPYSISTALAMTYGGARGETADQINKTLHFGGQGATHPAFSYLKNQLNTLPEKKTLQLNIANSLWPQREIPFRSDYLALIEEFYGSEVKPVDFKTDTEGARQTINTWVENQTNQHIKDLIPAGILNSLTRLVLVNAIYFKGDWASPFKSKLTHPAPFKLSKDNSVDVPMMSQTDTFKLAQTKDLQVIELPYKGGDLSMLIFLPIKPDAMPTLTTNLLSSLQFQPQEVMLQLPKFKLESSFYLGQTLANMGMPIAFSPQADFSGMTDAENLFIGEIIHKSFVEVTETGTEAAAATAVGIQTLSMPESFTANHPFLFIIRENSTGIILFIGRVTNPA